VKVSYIVHKNGFLTRLASGTLVAAAAAAAALLTGGVASAAALPRSVDVITAILPPATAAGGVQFDDGSATPGDWLAMTNGTVSTTVALSSIDHFLNRIVHLQRIDLQHRQWH
jgi:hypothetical protein